MDKIKCAVCGGQKIRKESDLYVCQTCGIEYTLGQVQELYYQKNLKQEDLLAKAKECYRRKEYRKSCRLCQQLLASGAKEPEAQLYLALSQARLHFHSEGAREQLVSGTSAAIATKRQAGIGRSYFDFCSRALGEVLVLGLAYEEAAEKVFYAETSHLDSSSPITIAQAEKRLSKELMASWETCDQVARACVSGIEDFSEAGSGFWDLIAAMLDDLNINAKRGIASSERLQEERTFFAKLQKAPCLFKEIS